MPIILYVQIFSHYYSLCILFYLIILFLIYKLLTFNSNKLILFELSSDQVRSLSDDRTSESLDEHFLYNRVDEKLVRLSISIFRSLLLIITSIAILAVDFRSVFPIDLRKSAFYGISLMDVGVGFFILGSAMRVIRNNSTVQSNSSNSFRSELRNFPRKFYLTVKGSYLIFLIGFIKLIIMKALHYGSQVGEYGVHWNFFFSLYLVRVSKKLFLNAYFKRIIVASLVLNYSGNFVYLRVVHKKERDEISDNVNTDWVHLSILPKLSKLNGISV